MFFVLLTAKGSPEILQAPFSRGEWAPRNFRGVSLMAKRHREISGAIALWQIGPEKSKRRFAAAKSVARNLEGRWREDSDHLHLASSRPEQVPGAWLASLAGEGHGVLR
jgi:hypothetical protein